MQLALVIGREGVAEDGDAWRAGIGGAIEGDDVEAADEALETRVGLQIVRGKHDEATLFGRRHRCGGGAEARAAFGTHLDEAEDVAFHRDEVDLANARAELALEDAESVACEVVGRQRFVLITALPPVRWGWWLARGAFGPAQNCADESAKGRAA